MIKLTAQLYSPRPTPIADSDAPPPKSDGKTKGRKKSANGSRIDTAFAEGYRAAYTTIYDRNDYAAAIEQLKASRDRWAGHLHRLSSWNGRRPSFPEPHTE
jgi:hypothetical protein